MTEVKVKGARKLRAELKRAGIDIADLKEAHAEASHIAERAARPLTPVGATRRLKGSLRSSGTKTAAILRAGRKSVPYAGPIHWGWPKRRIKPQPFMSDGAEASRPQWLPVYQQAVDAVLSKIKGEK